MGEHLIKLVVEGRKARKRIVHDKNTGDDVLRRQAEGGVPGDALVPQPGPAGIASRASARACVAVARCMCVNTLQIQLFFIAAAPVRRARDSQVVAVGFQAPVTRKGAPGSTTPGWGCPE